MTAVIRRFSGDTWIGFGADKSALSYVRADMIVAVDDMSLTFANNVERFRCAIVTLNSRSEITGVRAHDMLRALDWFNREIEEGRDPGVHVIEQPATPEPPVDGPFNQAALSDPLVRTQAPSAASIMGGVPVDEYIRKLEGQ